MEKNRKDYPKIFKRLLALFIYIVDVCFFLRNKKPLLVTLLLTYEINMKISEFLCMHVLRVLRIYN